MEEGLTLKKIFIFILLGMIIGFAIGKLVFYKKEVPETNVHLDGPFSKNITKNY